ncbi:MAG: tetratricopeptide repeat protein, partial [Parascardovia denticolens]
MVENHSGSRGGNRSGNRGGNSRGGFHGGNRSGRPGQGGNGGGHGHYGHFGHSDHSNHTDHFGKGGQRGFKRYDHNDHKNRYDRDRSDRSDRGFRPRRHDDEGRRGYGDRRDGRRGNRFDDRRDGDRRDDRRAERRGNHYEDRPGRPFDKRERGNHQGRQSSSNYDNGRRNSDGTVSYPSQNPYTDRRPGEPKMPAGMEWSMLSKEEKERLRGLSKEHAENIGLHMLAAFALEESDPEAALDHAKWIAKQASRIDMTRETLALIAYRMGDYRLALREFRTAFRMNGYGDYLPFMADCERGLGNPKRAIEIATSEDARYLQGESKAELFLVYAGALADLG